MYICVYMYMYMYIYIYICICVHITHIYVYTCVRVRAQMQHVLPRMYLHSCMYVCNIPFSVWRSLPLSHTPVLLAGAAESVGCVCLCVCVFWCACTRVQPFFFSSSKIEYLFGRVCVSLSLTYSPITHKSAWGKRRMYIFMSLILSHIHCTYVCISLCPTVSNSLCARVCVCVYICVWTYAPFSLYHSL